MRAVFGLLLVMLGLAMAIVWMPEHDSERQLAVVTDIATQGSSRRSDAIDRSGRTFSPATPLIASVEQRGTSQPQHTAAVARVVRTAPGGPAAMTADAPQVQPTNTTVVAQAIPGATVISPATVAGSAGRSTDQNASQRAATMNETQRADLVRNLQRELKRVSCYAGDIDGDWGTGSRRAMAAFTDRVNASLPIDQPDFILLTLVQGHQGSICGKSPTSVIAQVRRGQDRRNNGLSNDVVQYSSTQTATAPSSQDAGWTTQVTRTPASSPAPAPSIAASAAVAAAATVTLPGRMAMGGPPTVTPPEAVPSSERSLAKTALRIQPGPVDDTSVRPVTTTERRERPRRATRGVAGSYRYAPVVIRAPRIFAPTYYASAPRRGRSWTGSFFGFN